MPKTRVEASNELGIQLDHHQASFRPGDIITGAVIRKIHTVSTRARVTVKLYGRVKSKLTKHRHNGNGRTTDHYRGRFNLIAQNELPHKIFDGPVHIPPAGNPQMWNFSLHIPMGPSPSAVKTGNSQDRSYLPLTDEAITVSSLPSSFAFERAGWNEEIECFVEYYIDAELWQENTTHLSKASLPITVLEAPIPYPMQTIDLKTGTYSGCFKSQRLVPGMEDAELTFHQRMQKLFGSSKVAQFGFYVQVDYPTTIQMQHPSPIPFKVRVVSDRGRTSDIIADVPQTINITSLNIQIEATTSIICEGTFSSKTASGTRMYDFAEKGTMLGVRSPIAISADANSKPLDLGALLELSLHPNHANARGKPLYSFGVLYPSFVTYSIKHSHRLKWELGLQAAGESTSISGCHPVCILAAS